MVRVLDVSFFCEFFQPRPENCTFLGSPTGKNLPCVPDSRSSQHFWVLIFSLSPPPRTITFSRQLPSPRLFSLRRHCRGWLKHGRDNFAGPASSSPTTYIRKPHENEPPSKPEPLPPLQTTSHRPLSPSSHHPLHKRHALIDETTSPRSIFRSHEQVVAL